MNKEELKQEGINYACEYPSIQELGYKRFGYKRIDLRKAYIAGAEPREKRIAELEGQVTRAFEVLEGKRKRIEELEKENAELKETLKTYNGCGDWDNDFHTCRVYLQHEELQMYIEQLTEAKEIIKTLLSSKTDFDERRFALWAWKEEVNEAEQFLKE